MVTTAMAHPFGAETAHAGEALPRIRLSARPGGRAPSVHAVRHRANPDLASPARPPTVRSADSIGRAMSVDERPRNYGTGSPGEAPTSEAGRCPRGAQSAPPSPPGVARPRRWGGATRLPPMPVSAPTRLVVRTAALVGTAALIAGFILGPLPARASAPSPSSVLSSPLEPFVALALFDRPDAPWGAGHRGIDIAASVGQPVLSPDDGVVTFAGPVADRGVIVIAHADGFVTSLEPVAASVAVGDRVSRGQSVGLVTAARGHCVPATCVHWGVRREGEYVNPLDVLQGFGPVVLLPVARRGLRVAP